MIEPEDKIVEYDKLCILASSQTKFDYVIPTIKKTLPEPNKTIRGAFNGFTLEDTNQINTTQAESDRLNTGTDDDSDDNAAYLDEP